MRPVSALQNETHVQQVGDLFIITEETTTSFDTIQKWQFCIATGLLMNRS